MNAEEYIARQEQKVIENLWSARNAVTVDDMEFLAELKVEYGDCCGLESNCPLEIKIERDCSYCGKPADSLGYCENMRRFMECEPKSIPGNPCVYGCGETSCHYTLYVCENARKFGACLPQTAEDVRWGDRAFLNSCGIAVDDAPRVARGVVYSEIAMQGASVRKAREAHAARNRKPLMSDERRGHGTGECDLGELS
jgi:hypothetical protein